MSPDSEARAIVALNLYPWLQNALTDGDKRSPAYCAVGALLHYVGGDLRALRQFPDLARPAELLKRYYDLPSVDVCAAIMRANDSSHSREETIGRVLAIMSGSRDPGLDLGRACIEACFSFEKLSEGEDEGDVAVAVG